MHPLLRIQMHILYVYVDFVFEYPIVFDSTLIEFFFEITMILFTDVMFPKKHF